MSPVGRPVLATTSLLNRSGCSAASRSPIKPPQSCPTRVTRCRSSASNSQFPHPFDVACIAVVLDASRLVRATEADQVGADDAVPGRGQHRDHLAVEEGPRRFAMQHQHRVGVGRAVLHPSHPQRATLAIGNIGIVCNIRKFRQPGEPIVGCAQRLHECEDTPGRSALLQTGQAWVRHQLIEQGELAFQQLGPGLGHREPLHPVDLGEGAHLP